MSLELFNDLLTRFSTMGPELLLALAVIGLCYALRVIPAFPNKWIPAVCIFSPTFLYPVLASGDGVGVVRCAIIGFLIGWASWLVHVQVVKRLEARLGKREDHDTGI